MGFRILPSNRKNTSAAAESIICAMSGVNTSIIKAPICPLAVLFLFLSGTGFSQTTITPGTGLIEGVILDQQNKPIPNANVWAFGEKDNLTKPITTTSDAAGKFTLHGISFGRIYVFGFKESEGYPYGFPAF